jgi:hypothetical protein
MVVVTDDNPFERYGLDPREGIVAITQRLKELAEDASSDAERERIRAAWEELTLHPARRLRAALNAHPETRAPLGSPPLLPRLRVLPPELTLRDLAARPSAVAALPREISDTAQPTDPSAWDAPSLDDDALF